MQCCQWDSTLTKQQQQRVSTTSVVCVRYVDVSDWCHSSACASPCDVTAWLLQLSAGKLFGVYCSTYRMQQLVFFCLNTRQHIYTKPYSPPLAIRWRIHLCLFVHLIRMEKYSCYVQDIVEAVSIESIRHLRSADTSDYRTPRLHTKLGERAFSFARPPVWNALSYEIGNEADTKKQ